MFTLPALPFGEDALEPHLSAKAMQLHHGKHHKAYVDALNELVHSTPLAEMPLEQVILNTADSHFPGAARIFNNAAQHWNHAFYWQCLAPDGGGAPAGRIGDLIERDFGSYDNFRHEFVQQGKNHFGSGWLWLAASGESTLELITTHDADTPIARGASPLLACDLWEHAYYLDYENDRPEFLESFLDHLVHWRHAESRLDPVRAFVELTVARDA